MTTGELDAWDFFISYAAPDQGWADWVASVLEDAGYQVFIFHRDSPSGGSWLERIDDALKHSRRVIALLSASYLASEFSKMEWQAAIQEDPSGLSRRLIPVRIESVAVSGILSRVASIDLIGLDEDSAKERLLRQIAAAVRGGGHFGQSGRNEGTSNYPGRERTAHDTPRLAESPTESSGRPAYPRRVIRSRILPPRGEFNRVYNDEVQAAPHSDTPSKDDALGMTSDVRMLASLAAAQATSPPLSIALLGNWGSGKSSFMLQMAGEVKDKLVGRTGYIQSVRQIHFNAWHYSDVEVWTGLVGRLFQCLARTADESDGVKESTTENAKSDRTATQQKMDYLERYQIQLAADLARIEGAPSGAGVFRTIPSLPAIALILKSTVRQVWRDLRSSWHVLAIGAAGAVACSIVWYFGAEKLKAVGSLIASGFLLTATTSVIFLRPAMKAIRGISQFSDARHEELSHRLEEAATEMRALREHLALVDTATALATFLDKKGSSTSYGNHQGIVGQVRTDLESLSSFLIQAQAEWRERGGVPPLERIILYIDDLDRCPPSTVVKMLEAIHLLLALPLFVVVVAVDIRWLLVSLSSTQAGLFQSSLTSGFSSEEASAWALEYLDKIFQIPFALRPMGDRADGYIRSLLPQIDQAAEGPPAGQMLGSTDLDAMQSGVPGGPDAGGETVSIGARETIPEPSPANLKITTEEQHFIPLLSELLPSPRAAKKLINLYRLIRIGIEPSKIGEFVGTSAGGEYQIVLLLLAMVVGRPTAAPRLLLMIHEAPEGGDIEQHLLRLADEEAPSEAANAAFELGEFVRKLRSTEHVMGDLSLYQYWSTEVLRFSLHVRT